MPALDEEAAIGGVLSAIPDWIDEIVVVDNGSTDGTAQIARQSGATVVREPRRGYGAACLRGLTALHDPGIVVFLDADTSSDPREMERLVAPIQRGDADLVIGSRVLGHAESGSLTPPQRFGNALASFLIGWLWNFPCTDLGPFRAIRYESLLSLRMNDLDYGWTAQMQLRALSAEMRLVEVPVGNYKRVGRSKISGTVRGVVGAGTKILSTIAGEWRHKSASALSMRDVMLFTRFPEAGSAKTRLIPTLGAEGAALLQRDLTMHILSVLERWHIPGLDRITVHFAGGGVPEMRDTFGHKFRYVPQCGGLLGDKMQHGFQQTFDAGAGQVVAIGADCPYIGGEVLDEAFGALRSHDAVIGPASDGGYYLIGMRRPHPELFEDISWGGPLVLRQTLDACARLGLRVAQLAELSDIDTPEDLAAWQESESAKARPEASMPRLSIIIPTLNEAEALPETLASIGGDSHIEVIVVDGGSTDATAAIAESHGARVLHTKPGRAVQLNAGAGAARGAVLLFLHADTRLPFGFRSEIEIALRRPGVAAGAFRFAVDAASLAYRLLEGGTNFRSRFLASPYGDQGIFLDRNTFREIGGYPDLPVMEDFALVSTLRRRGKIAIARSSAITSGRRWREHGVLPTTCRHLAMVLGWYLGVSPASLARLRPKHGRSSSGPPWWRAL